MTEKLAVRLTGIARAMRAVLGAPDYQRYLAHIHAAHPDEEPMSCEQFMNDRMENRYNRTGARCC